MNGSSYRFSDFRIDIGARELWRGPQLLTVSPKVFDCIAYLIENRERAVGRDELIAAVWGRADIADVQLSYLMRKIRRTLGDSGEGQNLIRTIPRFGFRWLADVSNELPTDADTHTAPAGASRVVTASRPADAHRLTRRTRWWTIAWVSLVVALASMASVYLWRHRAPASDATTRIGSVAAETRSSTTVFAVLPVTGDISGDSDWMRLGLMDSIAGRLRSAALVVAPSADIVVLTRNETTGDDLVGRTRTAIGAREVVAPTALRGEHGWTVRLELHTADGRQREVEARAPDAILAAREAADRLLDLLGVAPSDRPAMALSTADFLQRIEAALLVTDFVRARQLIEAAPVALRELPEAQLQLGRIEVATDQPDLAHPRFAKLLNVVSAADDPVLRARVLTALGVADLNRPAEALPRFSEAIALLENLDEPVYLGDAYNDRGIANKGLGRYDGARVDYARARMAYAIANDTLGLAHIDNNEAAMDIQRGHPADALPLLARAAERFERVGAFDLLVNPLVNEISVHLDLLQATDALTVFQRARSKFDHLESKADLHIWKIHGAAALVANGRLREARTLLDEVVTAVDSKREFGVFALAHSLGADLEFSARRFQTSMLSARQAVNAMRDPHRLVDARARASLTLIRALRGMNRNADADVELARFAAWATDPSRRLATQFLRLAEAEQAATQGRLDAAGQVYDEILRSAQSDGTPAEFAEIAVSFGNALIDNGDLPRAGTVVGQIGRWTDRDFSCALLRLRLYHVLGKPDAWRVGLDKAQALAGERPIPPALASLPGPVGAALRR